MQEGTTDRYEVVDQRLRSSESVNLSEWLDAQREAKNSWQTIAFKIWTLTRVQVNPETLRRWHRRQATQEGDGQGG